MFKIRIACFTVVMSCSLHKYHTFPQFCNGRL